MSVLSKIFNIGQKAINGIGNTFENMFKTPETEEEIQKNKEQMEAWNKAGQKINDNSIKDELSQIKNFIPNLISGSIIDLTNGGKTNFSKNIIDNTPIIGDIKKEVESNSDKTPNEEEINEYKDDTNNMLMEFMKQQEETRKKELQEAYEREDTIRKETQAREDSAYQRAVEDMRKAGINPNLVGISPSASGGGITSASRTEQILGSEIQSFTTILNALIEKDTTISEGDKNRITQLLSSASNMFIFSKIGGK